MLIHHQCGHNFTWNVESFEKDGSGDGLILSPVNIAADKIKTRIPEPALRASLLDPQFYLPEDPKQNLATYSFFPANIASGFSTSEFNTHASEVARECLAFQNSLGMKYHVIPTRYFDDLPDSHLEQLTELFVQPFIDAKKEAGYDKPLVLTVIAKPIHLEPGVLRDELLSWATGFPEVSGVYLMFDYRFYSKQIKDPGYLASQMRFIRALRNNDMDVHVGYTGVEGLLLSLADATSVTMGSYENLRSFGVGRLQTRERTPRRGPRARIYSGRLLQSIEDLALPPMRELVSGWQDYFDDSPYREYLLNPESKLNFQKAEVYKHYFFVKSRQVRELPTLSERPAHLQARVSEALALFDQIRQAGVHLDGDSDGSHLPAWLNAISMFSARPV